MRMRPENDCGANKGEGDTLDRLFRIVLDREIDVALLPGDPVKTV